MRFADIKNIWIVDLPALSNADRGRVYFERAKQVVVESLADPVKRDRAVKGTRFRRDYLVEQIGSQPAVTVQNPRIRSLLVNTDRQLARGTRRAAVRPLPGGQPAKVRELRTIIDTLQHRIEVQAAKLVELHRKLGESGGVEVDLMDDRPHP